MRCPNHRLHGSAARDQTTVRDPVGEWNHAILLHNADGSVAGTPAANPSGLIRAQPACARPPASGAQARPFRSRQLQCVTQRHFSFRLVISHWHVSQQFACLQAPLQLAPVVVGPLVAQSVVHLVPPHEQPNASPAPIVMTPNAVATVSSESPTVATPFVKNVRIIPP